MENLLPKFETFSLENYPSLSTFKPPELEHRRSTNKLNRRAIRLIDDDDVNNIGLPIPQPPRRRRPRQNRILSLDPAPHQTTIDESPLAMTERYPLMHLKV